VHFLNHGILITSQSNISLIPLQRGIVPEWVGEEDVPDFIDTQPVEAGSVGSW